MPIEIDLEIFLMIRDCLFKPVNADTGLIRMCQARDFIPIARGGQDIVPVRASQMTAMSIIFAC
jgi:hypothetical protein